jgi:hypothetical protein
MIQNNISTSSEELKKKHQESIEKLDEIIRKFQEKKRLENINK